MRTLAGAFILIAMSAMAQAEARPIPDAGDPRMQTIRFKEDTPIVIMTSPGDDLTVLLAGDEKIVDIRLSNHAAYQATIASRLDSFTLHTSAALKQGMVATNTTMQVVTDRRLYDFVLSPASDALAPMVLRFTYGGTKQGTSAAGAAGSDQYRLSGNRELLPTSIRDDGAKTYIEWGHDQAIPAVFALDRLGREQMVDGYMRANTFTIDRVHDRLVFRIDKIEAEARRSAAKVVK